MYRIRAKNLEGPVSINKIESWKVYECFVKEFTDSMNSTAAWNFMLFIIGIKYGNIYGINSVTVL